jgi:glycosyltransferase involved in cell wall biosynthesis
MHANAMAAAASLRISDVRWIQSIQTTQPWPRWHWMVQRIAHRAAELVVVPSQSVARSATEWSGIPAEKIVVIPNAIDLADWAGNQSDIPASNPRPYPITFLGRLDPVKDVPTLVRAAAELKELVHLHIYGEGSDRTRIAEAIKQTNSPATMHGLANSPQDALAHSGLLVLPSLAEGFGLVLIEAMTAGVPVVATDVAGVRDVIRNNQTGLLVQPSNPAGLAEAIRRIVEDGALRERLVKAAAQHMRAEYTWNSALCRYQELLGFEDIAT